MEPARLILIAEEDRTLRAFLADNLTADGYEVLIAEDKESALALLERRPPDLVVCDVNGDTLALVDAIRDADGLASRVLPDTPLIVLTSHVDELARVRFLERGGDDVVSKPFSYAELRARIRAVLHRAYTRRATGRIRVGPLMIDPVSRAVSVHDQAVQLSKLEFALLLALATEPTRVRTKEELLREVWGFRTRSATRTLDSHACRLRHKLAVDGARFVINVWGVGYRLIDGPLRHEHARDDAGSPAWADTDAAHAA
jgi:DNA-binding response OmpR family regulator